MGRKTLPRSEVEFVFVSAKLLQALSYTSVDLDCCGNVFKAFQVFVKPLRKFISKWSYSHSFPNIRSYSTFFAFKQLELLEPSFFFKNCILK